MFADSMHCVGCTGRMSSLCTSGKGTENGFDRAWKVNCRKNDTTNHSPHIALAVDEERNARVTEQGLATLVSLACGTFVVAEHGILFVPYDEQGVLQQMKELVYGELVLLHESLLLLDGVTTDPYDSNVGVLEVGLI